MIVLISWNCGYANLSVCPQVLSNSHRRGINVYSILKNEARLLPLVFPLVELLDLLF